MGRQRRGLDGFIELGVFLFVYVLFYDTMGERVELFFWCLADRVYIDFALDFCGVLRV